MGKIGGCLELHPTPRPFKASFFDGKKNWFNQGLNCTKIIQTEANRKVMKIYENDITRWIVDDIWINLLCNKTPCKVPVARPSLASSSPSS